MANLDFCDKHNMVAYLQKSEGSEGFHQIIDFLSTSHIKYALTESPTIYVSLIEQFWQTAFASTPENGEMEITATIDGKVKVVFEAFIRRHLKLEDSDGISTLPNAEIFEQLAYMGYVSNSDSLTFQKGHFSPQWKFLIHTILHSLSPKKTAWEQFSSNIATAIICLATNRTFNFSKLIFEAMVKNLDSKTKFLMYPIFIQIFLNKHKRLLLPHKKTYIAPTLTHKLFRNMRRASKGYTGVNTPLFQTMLVQGQNVQGEGSTIPIESHHIPTSAPSTSQPQTSSPSMQTIHAALMPHDSPIPRVHSLGSDKGSLTLNELTLILKVKKLEKSVKTSQARRRAKIVVSDDEEYKEDSSKQRRSLIEDMDLDAGISLVPLHVSDQGRFDDKHVSNQPEEQLGVFSATKVLANAARIRRGVVNVHTYTRRRTISTAGMARVSTASGLVITTGMAQEVEINIPSPVATKDKGKAFHEEEQARFNVEHEAKFNEEQEQERLDYEAAVRLHEELDESERQRMSQVHQAAQGFTNAE
ncbi:hypothetical protein Tco_1152715 [Tanacetum coccineum]